MVLYSIINKYNFNFAILYLITGIEVDGSIIQYSLKNINRWDIYGLIPHFNEALNLSIGMFAGVGINNAQPIALNYMLANSEILIGVVMAGIGIGTLTRKIVR